MKYGAEGAEDKESSPCLSEERGAGAGLGMWGARRRVTVDVLMACWGLGTWLGVNGVYMQLPLLVERLPEGWALPNMMVLAIQLANVGILAYAALKRLLPRTAAVDASCIYALLAVGTLALVLNAFLYERTTAVRGAERSVAFLSLTFFAGLVGCTSSVVFYPYLRHFRDVYLTTYLVGEGLGGFLPSLLALAQGVGGAPECLPSADNSTLVAHYPPPRFGTTAFLLLLSALSAASLCGFLLLNTLRAFDSERVAAGAVAKDEEATAPRESLLTAPWLAAMSLMVALNALMNGVLPSIQSYSCMPYGANAYHLAVTLGALANPAACLAGVWLRPLSARALAALLAAALAPLAYIAATALLSPTPPLQRAPGAAGVALVVAAWVAVSGAVSYARMWVYGWARGGGARGMRVCGVVTQLGSALGTALITLLISLTALFTQEDACASMTL